MKYTIGATIILYLAFSLGNNDLDTTLWTDTSRIMFGCYFALIWFIYLFIKIMKSIES